MCHTVDVGTLQAKPLPWDQAEPHNRGRAHICSHVLYIYIYIYVHMHCSHQSRREICWPMHCLLTETVTLTLLNFTYNMQDYMHGIGCVHVQTIFTFSPGYIYEVVR